MKIDIPKFLLFVMMTTATAVAADSSSTLAAKVAIGEEKSLLNNEERPTTEQATTEGVAASSSSSSSLSSSLVEVSAGADDDDVSAQRNVVDGSSSKTRTMHHTVADAAVSDVLLETPADSGGRFSSSDINNLRRSFVFPVSRGDGSSSKTGTMHHTVASDVSLETLSVDSMDTLASDDVQQSKQDRAASSDGRPIPPSDIVNHHAVVDAINDDDEISSFTGTDVSAQRKLIKSSKKVKNPKALCTLSLFADSLFMYANQCFTDIMVTISPCDNKDDTCYISERLPSVPQEEQEEQENQEEEQCFVGGSFPAKQNIQYNPSTGDCEFLYVDLVDDPCNLYTGVTGTGSLGLKARINVKNNPDVMFIQFTNDKGLTFYNDDNERVAKKRSSTQDNRYLRPEGAMKPVMSMMPHPFASHHRRMSAMDCNDAIFDGNVANPVGFYPKAKIRNDTPYRSNWVYVEYMGCADDENDFIASGGTWTGPTRGGCLINAIYGTLTLHDDSVLKCNLYEGKGTGYSQFYIMFIDGVCCLRSSHQDSDKCPELKGNSAGDPFIT